MSATQHESTSTSTSTSTSDAYGRPEEQVPSVWTDCVRYTPRAPLTWDETKDDQGLRAVMATGRVLYVIGRNSASAGRAGCRDSANDAWDTLAWLDEEYGLGLLDSIPTVEEMAAMLTFHGYLTRTRGKDGKVFRNRFVLIELVGLGVVISLSAGSAVKENRHGENPHSLHAARLMAENAAGFVAKRPDRLSRTEFGWVPYYRAALDVLEATGSVFCADSSLGKWRVGAEDFPAELSSYARAAAREARDLRRKKTRTQRRLTEPVMTDGKVACAVPQACPPGFMSYRDRRTDKMVLAVDTPKNYPNVSEAVGLPQVFMADKVTRADQAAILRRVLPLLGRENRSLAYHTDLLVALRYSTQQLRWRWGIDAYFGSPAHAVETPLSGLARALESTIGENLSVFTEGRLQVSVDGVEQELTGLWHPDGEPWMSAADKARVVEYFAKRGEGRNMPVASWSAMPAELDGEPVELRPGTDGGTSFRDFTWHIRPVRHRGQNSATVTGAVCDEPADRADCRPTRRAVRVPDADLTASFVDGVVAAEGELFAPLVGAEVRKRRITELESKRDHARSRVEDIERDISEQSKAAFARGADGNYLHREPTQHALLAEVDRLATPLAAAQATLVAARVELETEAAGPTAGVDNTDLQLLFDGLRNPFTGMPRHLVRRAVRDLCFTTRQVRHANLKGFVLEWTGNIVLSTAAGERIVPFSGRCEQGGATQVHEMALKALAALRAGRPVLYRSKKTSQVRCAAVASLLGRPAATFRPANVMDPHLLRLWMAVLFPQPAEGERESDVVTVDQLCRDPEMLADFGGEHAIRRLAERMGLLDATHCDSHWKVRGGEREAALTVASMTLPRRTQSASERADETAVRKNMSLTGRAARWDFSPGLTPALRPCPHCGSEHAASMRLREVAGYVCLNPSCRLDQDGVRWASRYDRYISGATELVAAGIALDVAPGFTGAAHELRADSVQPERLIRTLEPIPEAVADKVVEMYRARSTHRVITATTGLKYHRIDQVLTERKVPRHRDVRDAPSAPPLTAE